MKITSIVFLIAAIAVGSIISFAEDSNQSSAPLDELEMLVASVNKKLIKLEHDIVYKDPECKAAYAAVKKAEEDLLTKRKILTDKMDRDPEISKLRAERQNAYAKLQAFKKSVGNQ